MNDIDISSLDLNLLKALRFLLEEKNVSRAARRMHVSQSAMSHTLARLREAFADPLFVRISRGLEPTERAMELYPQVCGILDQIAELLTPAEFHPTSWHENLVIHSHDFIVSGYLAQRLSRIYDLAPQLTIELSELNERSYQLMDEGKVDLIISAGIGVSDKHRQLHCIDDEIVCLCDADHPLNESSSAKDFFDFPHVQLNLLERHLDPISVYAARQKFVRYVRVKTDTLNVQPGVLLGTSLLAFVPKILADKACSSGELKNISLPFEIDEISIRAFWHERNQNNTAMIWLRNQVFH